MLKIFFYNFRVAVESMTQNKLRAVLTSLGIIFGVGSVISMLAIGKGAEFEIVEKMKLLGTNNIIVKPIDKNKPRPIGEETEEETESTDKKQSGAKKYSPGLSLEDKLSIENVIPDIRYVSPEIVLPTEAIRSGKSREINLVGIDSSYFRVNASRISSGSSFTPYHEERPVCIIGQKIAIRLFAGENPVGKRIKCGKEWLTVIGITGELKLSNENISNLGLRDLNNDIYVPINTMLLKFINRSLITEEDLDRRQQNENIEINNHQIDRMVVQVKNTEKIKTVAAVIENMLLRRHNDNKDFEVIVPELLLEQEQSTKRIFNIVLGAIASISLLVGGIGIMNIMLASVLERTKEIGIRKAVGAKRADILLQFLIEAVSISLTGGLIGIIIGVGGSILIESLTDIQTIVSPFSVALAFLVSISIGLIFGITPARKAAQQDPIDLLRYE
ncbi:MAG: ABC transporter permease [Bacteroidota bacterium]